MQFHLSRFMGKGYLSHRRTGKVQTSPRIRTVLKEPSLFAHIPHESRASIRQGTTPLTQLTGCACAFEGPQTVIIITISRG